MKSILPLSAICLLLLTACLSGHAPDKSSMNYFDLKNYFENQAAALEKKNALIEKTVTKNDLAETKRITIKNWSHELGLFSGSDINKPSWASSYEIQSSMNETRYLARDSSLKTRRIDIFREGNGEIKHIFIINKIDNQLYSSHEELHYYPDSLYSIRKNQKIRMLGNNAYTVKGLIVR